MKTINKNTLLKCGNKIFQPIEVDDVVYWVNFTTIEDLVDAYYISTNNDKTKEVLWLEEDSIVISDMKIIAQSQPKLEGISVISSDSYVEILAKETRDSINKVAYCCSGETEEDIFDSGFIISHKTNPNQYTQKDIEKAIKLARVKVDLTTGRMEETPIVEILEQINSISVIEVDEQFNILSYE